MSRKSKIDSAEKVKIVEHLLADEISVSEAARLTGVDKASIRRWRNLYLADGPTALMVQRNNKVYSQELKLQAVHEYLDGVYFGLKDQSSRSIRPPVTVK